MSHSMHDDEILNKLDEHLANAESDDEFGFFLCYLFSLQFHYGNMEIKK